MTNIILFHNYLYFRNIYAVSDMQNVSSDLIYCTYKILFRRFVNNFGGSLDDSPVTNMSFSLSIAEAGHERHHFGLISHKQKSRRLQPLTETSRTVTAGLYPECVVLALA